MPFWSIFCIFKCMKHVYFFRFFATKAFLQLQKGTCFAKEDFKYINLNVLPVFGLQLSALVSGITITSGLVLAVVVLSCCVSGMLNFWVSGIIVGSPGLCT